MSRSYTRRDFLKRSLFGAGFTIAVYAMPSGYGILDARESGNAAPCLFRPNAWIQITPDEQVTVFINKSEMGQGVYTALAMIVADELEADWKQVRIKSALAAQQYIDPAWGVQSTGGSSSVRHMYEPLRKAGAAARSMLINAAAEKWNVSPDACEALEGRVIYKQTGLSLTYGQLCERAAGLPVPQNPSLKRPEQFRLIGSSLPRLDAHDKAGGCAVFGIDVFIDGMLYAVVARPPSYGAKAVSYDEEAARKIDKVRSVVVIDRGIAVCADTLDAAWKGRNALNIKWDKGVHAGLHNGTLDKMFALKLDKKGVTARDEGDVRGALSRSAQKLDVIYTLPYLAHVTMEPMNCTAHVFKEKCEIWIPTQNQSGVLKLAERITGLKPEQIQVHTTYLGGGLGRRFETDVAEEALQIAKAVGKPVKLIWKREEDMQNDFYRPANCCRIEGGIDAEGNAIAWSHKIVAQSIFARAMPEMFKGGIDPAAVEGLINMEYEIPNIHVEYVKIMTPVPVGFWRSVGNSHNAFTIESFTDELAHAAGRDPLEFRLGLLKSHARARRVLEIAAEKAGWGSSLRQGEGRGIAQHPSFDSYVAEAAEVSVDKKSGRIKVHRVVCAVDCGSVINPDTVKAQMEGGIIMGLSAALTEKINLSDGGVVSSNFNNYEILRMSDIPEIEVHIVKSDGRPGGVGEPGVPPITPAVANAVFAATGVRLRQLPMRPEMVREAMGN